MGGCKYHNLYESQLLEDIISQVCTLAIFAFVSYSISKLPPFHEKSKNYLYHYLVQFPFISSETCWYLDQVLRIITTLCNWKHKSLSSVYHRSYLPFFHQVCSFFGVSGHCDISRHTISLLEQYKPSLFFKIN